MSSQIRLLAGIVACATLALVAFALAGPINPPAGTVQSSGPSLQDVFDALADTGGGTVVMQGSMPPAAKAYTDIDGVKGDATASQYPEWIETDNAVWGIAELNAGGQARMVTTDPDFGLVTLTLDRDKSFIPVINRLLNGVTIPFVQTDYVTVQQETDFRIRMENVRVVAVQPADSFTYQVSFIFDRIFFTQWTIDSEGNASNPLTTGWDLVDNTPI